MAERDVMLSATVSVLVTVELHQGWGKDCTVEQAWDQASRQARATVGSRLEKLPDMRVTAIRVQDVTAIAREREP